VQGVSRNRPIDSIWVLGVPVVFLTWSISLFYFVLMNHQFETLCFQCCGSKTFCYGSVSDFLMSSGSGSDFQKVPNPTIFTPFLKFLLMYTSIF
jgi:hypothetical protein